MAIDNIARGLASVASRRTDPTLPINRLKAAFRASPGLAPVAPASPATVTVGTASDLGSGGSTLINPQAIAGFSHSSLANIYQKSTWTNYFTTGANALGQPTDPAQAYYIPPATGSDGFAYTTIPFRLDSQVFEILARSADRWAIFADGKPVSTGLTVVPSAGGYAVRRITVDMGSRTARNIVLYATTFGFGGIAIPSDAMIGPLDTQDCPRIASLADSYGAVAGTWFNCGPHAEMVGRMITADTFPLLHRSQAGGSGFSNPGPGGHIYLDRVPNIAAPNPDMVIVSGGINDLSYTNTTLPAQSLATFQALRAALPNAVLANVGVWVPTSASLSPYRASRDAIYASLQQIAGPWVDADVTRGTWRNSAGASGVINPVPWTTGTGKVGSTTGIGNNDICTSADGIHPTVYGTDYLGGCCYTAIRAGILAL